MAELGELVYFEQSVEKHFEDSYLSNYNALISQPSGDVSLTRLANVFDEARIVRFLGWTRLGFFMSVDSFSQEDLDMPEVNSSITEHLGSSAVFAETYFSISQPITTFRPGVKATMDRAGIRSRNMPHLYATLNANNDKGLFIANEYDGDWLVTWPGWASGEGVNQLVPSALSEEEWESISRLRDVLHNKAVESLRS